MLLEGGTVVADGPSPDIVATYLQSVHGSGSHQQWPDLAEAPGDDLARMRSVRVVDEDGVTTGAVDVRRPVGIEIGFVVLRAGPPLVPKIKVYDKNGDVAFNAMDVHPRWLEPLAPGEHVATAWIPPNLLNEGLVSVDVGIFSMAAPKLHPHTGAYDAVSFHVQDPGEGDSARGLFTGQWKGVVRPLLEWTVEQR
jgi:lipopolysaccharide transport system ATP-binding protein